MTPTPRPYYGAVSGPEGIVERDNEIARLTAELAEAKTAYSLVMARNLPLAAEKVQAEEERDAALANCEQQRKLAMGYWEGMCKARAEADALKAEVEYLRLGLAPAEYSPGGSNMVVSCQSCGFQISWSSDSASPVCGKCRSTSWNIKTTARLAPAPAPKEASQ